MLYDLLQHDLGSFDRRKVPKTSALLDQKMLSLELHQQWYFEKLRSGTFTGDDPWELTPRFKVYDDYVESLKKNGVARRANRD